MAKAKVFRVDGGMVLIDEVENVSPDYNEEDYIRECREDVENAEVFRKADKVDWLMYVSEKRIVVKLYEE